MPMKSLSSLAPMLLVSALLGCHHGGGHSDGGHHDAPPPTHHERVVHACPGCGVEFSSEHDLRSHRSHEHH